MNDFEPTSPTRAELSRGVKVSWKHSESTRWISLPKGVFLFLLQGKSPFFQQFSHTIYSIKTQSFRMWSREVWESASVCKLLDHADEYEVRKLNLVYVLQPFNAWKICANLYQCAVLGKIVTIATSKKSWSSSHLVTFSAFQRRRCF